MAKSIVKLPSWLEIIGILLEVKRSKKEHQTDGQYWKTTLWTSVLIHSSITKMNYIYLVKKNQKFYLFKKIIFYLRRVDWWIYRIFFGFGNQVQQTKKQIRKNWNKIEKWKKWTPIDCIWKLYNACGRMGKTVSYYLFYY